MKKPARSSFVFVSIAVLVGIFAVQMVPYQFPNQYTPTTADLLQGGVYDRADEQGVFHGKSASSYHIPESKQLAQVLGENDGAHKRIEVDLTNQKVYAFEGDAKVMEFVVSTGKWGRTPTGTFKIAYKTRAQKMSGGNRAIGTYYYLPNVPFVQFFGNSSIPWSRGFSFHGTYWHENFGTPMSHGCVNMKTADAEKLFYWTNGGTGNVTDGTSVIIYGQTPTS